MADKRIVQPFRLVSPTTNSKQLAVVLAADSVSAGTDGGLLLVGSDGSNYRVFSTNSSGELFTQSKQSGTWNVTNISGTVSLPTGAATEASLAKLTVAQGTALGSNTVTLEGGSVTTSAPTYTTGQISPLSLTTSGALRVDIGATGTNATAIKVDGSAVTQPVSGTITANLGTIAGVATETTLASFLTSQGTALGSTKQQMVGGSVTTSAPTYTTGQINPLSLTTAGALRVDNSGVTQPISASSLPLPTGAATAAKQPALGTAGSASSDVITVQGIASMTALKVDGSAVTQPVSGTITANLGTIAGVATETSLAKLTVSQGASLGTNTQILNGASVTTSAPTYTNGQISPMTLTTAGSLRVDIGSTGTVAATQSGTWNVTNISGTVSLPTGAATSAKQDTMITSLQLIDDAVVADGASFSGAKTLVVAGVDGSTNAQALSTDTSGNLNVNIVGGSVGSNAPTSPVKKYSTTSALAAGSTTTDGFATGGTHSTVDLASGTYYLNGFTASSSVSIKVALHTVANSVVSTNPLVVVFGNAGTVVNWTPPHKDFMSFTSGGTAGDDGFLLRITNMDNSDAADVYSTIFYQS